MVALGLYIAGISPAFANIYVSPLGNDANIGAGGNPTPTSNYGPKLTLGAAILQARQIRAAQPGRTAPIYIILRNGTYEVPATIALTQADSGTAASPLIIEAYPGETPILSGGTAMAPNTSNASTWTVAVPAGFQGAPFSQLYVEGQRRQRVRMPKSGYYQVAASVNASDATANDAFQFSPGDIPAADGNGQVLVRAFHNWNLYTLQIASVNTSTNIVSFNSPYDGEPRVPFDATVWYRLENVPGAPLDPGEWYYNSQTLGLSYVPLAGESASGAKFVLPRLETLISVNGQAGTAGKKASYIYFQGITFAYTDWKLPATGLQYDQDAAATLGTVMVSSARNVTFTNCTFKETGAYGLEMGADVQAATVTGCTFENLGAGGMEVGSFNTADQEVSAQWTSNCTIENNLVSAYGEMHADAAGIAIGYANNITVQNNDVTNGFYSGITIGWTWGYGVFGVYANIIQQNRVWNVGQNVLSDMGAIYMLGQQPGTKILGNVVSDVQAARYHGCGIYCDAGSSSIAIENNLAYNFSDSAMFMNYGESLNIESNVFALGQTCVYEDANPSATGSVNLESNILETIAAPFFGPNGISTATNVYNNSYISLGGATKLFPGGETLAQWSTTDIEATAQNPEFADPQNGNFTAANPQYLTQRGINPTLFTTAGRTSGPAIQADPGQPFWDPAPNPQAIPFTANFDTGGGANDLASFTLSVASALEGVTVSSAECHSAPNSLEFTNGPIGLSWQPLAFRNVYIENGYAAISIWLYAQPGTTPWIACRDTTLQIINGPIVSVKADGNLYAGSTLVGTFPFNKWVRIQMSFGVGTNLTPTWTFTYTNPAGVVSTYAGLTMPTGFLTFDWFAVASYASAPALTSTSFFIDDVSVGVSTKAP